ncbi:MAG: hypothetical protein J5950_03405 [Clostridia bacterium]|nr:hypothetical protein [Clostridia bacterium]
MGKGKISIYNASPENDIRYSGPLSYRHLRIIAWLFVIMTVIGHGMRIGAKLDSDFAAEAGALPSIFISFWNIAVPLFLLANFAIVLNTKYAARRDLLVYGGASVAVIAAFFIITERYGIGLLMLITKGSEEQAHIILQNIIRLAFPNGFAAFNIFLDLLLCTLLNYFLNSRPKRIFTGKKIHIFRLFALIPIFYEIAAIVLKILAGLGKITLPVEIWPFLPAKPPATFLAFLALSLFIKIREKSFASHNKTQEDYAAFLHTNLNTWHFSIAAMIVFIVSGILDIVMLIAGMIMYAYAIYPSNDIAGQVVSFLDLLYAIGFGNSAMMIVISPFILLFNYQKTYKNRTHDIFIPIIAISVIALVVLEIVYQMVMWLPDFFSGLFKIF